MFQAYALVISPTRFVAEAIARSLREWGYLAFAHWQAGPSPPYVPFRKAVLVLDGTSGARDLGQDLLQKETFAGAVLIGQTEAKYLESPFASRLTLAFLDASAGAQELITALEKVARGVPYISRMLDRSPEVRTSHAARVLTPREKEVARLLAQRYSYRAICAKLSLRPGTLKSHVRVIYRKLGTRSREELTRLDLRGVNGHHTRHSARAHTA
jgi:DNA-binding CsgD family transcriptional regulator